MPLRARLRRHEGRPDGARADLPRRGVVEPSSSDIASSARVCSGESGGAHRRRRRREHLSGVSMRQCPTPTHHNTLSMRQTCPTQTHHNTLETAQTHCPNKVQAPVKLAHTSPHSTSDIAHSGTQLGRSYKQADPPCDVRISDPPTVYRTARTLRVCHTASCPCP